MDARQLVTQMMAALVRGDLAAHLAAVSEDVIAQVNESAPQHGKPAYRQILEMLRANGEPTIGFTLEETVSIPSGDVVVRVNEERQIPVGLRMVVHSGHVPGFYTVRGPVITSVKITALAGPNRAYRYP